MYKKSNLRSKIIILPITLEIEKKVILTYAITNTRAEGKEFID